MGDQFPRREQAVRPAISGMQGLLISERGSEAHFLTAFYSMPGELTDK